MYQNERNEHKLRKPMKRRHINNQTSIKYICVICVQFFRFNILFYVLWSMPIPTVVSYDFQYILQNRKTCDYASLLDTV